MLDQITSITQVGAKYWNAFEATSPINGIRFGGYICRQESEKLGLLALTQVNGVERLEFVYAMPKLHYPYQEERDGSMRVAIPLTQNIVDARFTIKLDGTAIIWYGLSDATGQVLEVIPRTRLQPILAPSRWGDWNALLQEVLPDRSGVERAVREQGIVLAFELWGRRNPHLIKYDVPLKLTLHTAIRHKKIVSHRLLADFAKRYGFELVESIEVVRPDSESLVAAYRRWQETMEAHNKAAGEGVYVEEGAVLVLSTAETATYFKCKPRDIEEIHWAQGANLSRELVQQMLNKMLENAYDFDKGSVTDLMTELEADFEPQVIAAERELIERVWQEFTLELQKRAWLRHLVAESRLDPRDLPNMMRHLSQHYPKKEMSWVYGTVKLLYGG